MNFQHSAQRTKVVKPLLPQYPMVLAASEVNAGKKVNHLELIIPSYPVPYVIHVTLKLPLKLLQGEP